MDCGDASFGRNVGFGNVKNRLMEIHNRMKKFGKYFGMKISFLYYFLSENGIWCLEFYIIDTCLKPCQIKAYRGF